MAKKRVHEVAKELKIESKELIDRLTSLGIRVKCNFSALSEEEIEKVRAALSFRPEKTEPTGERACPSGEKQEAKLVTGEGLVLPAAAEEKGALLAATTRETLKEEASSVPPRTELGTEAKAEKLPPKAPPLSKFGPGLVDKVPSRPPDRRFMERPFAFEKKTGRGIFAGATGTVAKSAPAAPVKTEQPQVSSPPPVKSPVVPPAVLHPEVKAPASPKEAGLPHARAGQKPGAQRPGARHPGEQDAKARITPGWRPGFPSGDKESRPAVDRRPKLGLIPPPPQVDKSKAPQKQERQKFDRKVKERPADRLLPQWEEEGEKLKSKLLKRHKETKAHPVLIKPVERKPLQIGETVTIKELAEKMQRKAADLIKRLMMLGMLVTINQEIDADTATILAQEFGYEVEVKPEFDIESLLAEALGELSPSPPAR